MAGLLIVIMIAVYFYYMNSKDSNTGQGTVVEKTELSKFEKIKKLNEQQSELFSPNEVIERNNIILSYLYGGELENEEEIDDLILFQRNLFDPDLLAINPYEEQVEKVKATLEEYKKTGYRIIEIKRDVVQYEKNNPNIAKIRVIQYTNSNKDNYLEYYLRKQEDGSWRILAWEITDEFSILNEF